jgi:hypothetical protein
VTTQDSYSAAGQALEALLAGDEARDLLDTIPLADLPYLEATLAELRIMVIDTYNRTPGAV